MHYDGHGAPGIKKITSRTPNGTTVDLGVPATVDSWEYGHNSDMAWGGWRQPIPIAPHPDDIRTTVCHGEGLSEDGINGMCQEGWRQ